MPDSKPLVLVVDDNVRLASTLSTYLEMEGFEVVTAHNAESALSAVDRRPPDLALLDINMPGIDGIEVCRRVRAAVPQMAILMVTGRSGDDDETKARAAGANGLVAKPLDLPSLHQQIRDLLAR